MIPNINQRFSKLNPFTIFTYFIFVFIFLFERKSLDTTIIVFILISILAISYIKISTLKNSMFILILMFLMPLVFNFLFINDFQSAIKSSFFVCTFFLVFFCFNVFIDDNKIFHIFYKFLPNTALVLSISLRYNYLIIKKYNNTMECFKANNNKITLKSASDIFLALTSQILEDSINLAKSIKSKSFQNSKRTYYNNYSFNIFDIVILLIIVLLFFSNDYVLLLIILPLIYDFILNLWRIARCYFVN